MRPLCPAPQARSIRHCQRMTIGGKIARPSKAARMSQPQWEFWIDRGGTFTDIVARRPDGGLVTHKLLSENPETYTDAAIEGIRQLLRLARDAEIPPEAIEA